MKLLLKLDLLIVSLLLLNTIFIFFVSIFGRELQNIIFNIINKNYFYIFVSIIFVLGLPIIKILLRKQISCQKFFWRKSFCWIMLMLLSQYFITIPEEKVHLLLFSFLGFFSSFVKRYSVSIIFLLIISILDEVLQKILPNRFFSWDDVLINLYASLITVSIYKFNRN